MTLRFCPGTSTGASTLQATGTFARGSGSQKPGVTRLVHRFGSHPHINPGDIVAYHNDVLRWVIDRSSLWLLSELSPEPIGGENKASSRWCRLANEVWIRVSCCPQAACNQITCRI
jgi:hypothetical protein